MTFRLEDGGDVLVLDHPYVVMSFQDSGPEVRQVVSPLPSRDGVEDETAVAGARALTFALRILDRPSATRTELWDRLARFLHPSKRPVLVRDIECGNEAERRITVRAGGLPSAIGDPFVADHALSLQSVEPFWWSSSSSMVEALPGIVDEPGFTFPFTFPLDFGGSESAGSGRVDATSGGTAPAPLVTRIYGPCVNPSVRNLSNGGRLDFRLSIQSGKWLEVDTAARTVLANGSAGANRIHTLDFATRQWFGLEPGVNELRFVVDSSGSGARCEFTWQDHYL